MEHKSFWELIENSVHLNPPTSSGWRTYKCTQCNDYTERAAFKHEDTSIYNNCFNCGFKCVHDETSGKISSKFKSLLKSLGISDNQINEASGSLFFNKQNTPQNVTLETIKPKIVLHTPEIKLPALSYPIGVDHSYEIQLPLIEYLDSRKIDPIALNIHFSLSPKYLGRIIIPCVRDNKIIYWQARSIDPLEKPKYLSPGLNKEAVMWGYDNLWQDMDKPLFVTEGIFDAAPLNGVALIGSDLNASKLEVLRKCRRRKILVMDKDLNGAKLAELALQEGWEITWPGPTGRGAKLDVNKCVQDYGLIYTIWTLMRNTTTPTSVKTVNGLSLQSVLTANIEQSLAKLKGK